jgi:hypothetical protein
MLWRGSARLERCRVAIMFLTAGDRRIVDIKFRLPSKAPFHPQVMFLFYFKTICSNVANNLHAVLQ